MGRLKTNREKRLKKGKPMKKQINMPQVGSVLAPGLLSGVKADALEPVTCQCGHDVFMEVCNVRHAGRFQTATGQPMLVNFKGGFACLKCGAINKLNVPGAAKPEEEKEETSDGKTIQ